jgi:type I restriction-modification system DNA methylase subunit
VASSVRAEGGLKDIMARTNKKKIKLSEMAGQSEPRAPLDSAALLAAATPLLKRLEADLRARAATSPAVTRALEARWEAEKKAERTAESFAAWSAALATQVAAAWLLSCVFVRTLEDRGLLRRPRIAGPGALDSQKLFFQLAPSLTERDYLLTVFRELSRYPAARDLFDGQHSLVWKLSPSAELAKELLALFRTPNAEAPTFRFGQASTRFLGDLYQDLSEDVRKRYALLQTPDFIESFILDRTLEPAIQRFGLDDTTLIDPTCGSGHFLLGAFDRLFDHRLKKEPNVDVRVAAHKALDAVHGADINPYAVAIARFRLTLAFLDKAGYSKLADAPALPLHLVVADSLLHNPHQQQTELGHIEGQSAAVWGGNAFALEDEAAARAVLHRQYAAVVGNPPYITEKDPKRREVYRRMYTSAAGKYALSAPFCERFFQLARERGYVGQITANSFMKREFGKQLIESFLPGVNLELIVNTSGAYVPGHGTPTVLLFGTQQSQSGNDVLAVLAKRGEPSTPEDPSRGEVWSSISTHWSDVGFENDYVSVARMDVASLRKHPWSLGGGGAAELKELLEDNASSRLADIVESIGIASFTLEDDVFLRPRGAWQRLACPERLLKPMVIGEAIRDWSVSEVPCAFFPYTEDLVPIADVSPELRILWPYRTSLASNKLFGGKTKVEGGLQWYEYGRLTADKLRTPLTIVFAFVATHNHFVLDRGGRVFNRSAPIIKLPESATEDDHLALLAYLNSSTACFWMKQVFYPKATTTGDISSEKGKPEANRYEFAGSGMLPLPVPAMSNAAKSQLVTMATKALQLGAERDACSGSTVSGMVMDGVASKEEALESVQARLGAIERQLLVVQEDIDWLVYGLLGLVGAEVASPRECTANVVTRPFESVHGGRVAPLEWRDRVDALANNVRLASIEDLNYKRPWAGRRGVFGHGVLSLAEASMGAARTVVEAEAERLIALRGDSMRLSELVTALQADRAIVRLSDALLPSLRDALANSEAVPYLAAQRYTETGLAKWRLWQECWQAQREEDSGSEIEIRVPPKYEPRDFLEPAFFRLRGKLDVPKERFISYPGCESDQDGEPVYGWAGWNYLQRAQALASLYMKRKNGEAWGKERLTPMLAGLLELLPWIKQWHNEPSAEFEGLRMGDYFEQLLDGECRQLGLSHDDLLAWRPPKKTRGKPRTAARSTDTGATVAGVSEPDGAPAPKTARGRKKKATAAVEASTIEKPENTPGDPSA